WTGLTYVLDQAGLDLSRSQFIDLWVNDWRDLERIRGPHVKLHIDIGTVSEDQMPAPNVAPDDTLDTEDRNRDGVLQVTGDHAEDIGTDGQADGAESGDWDLLTWSPTDRHGDNFQGIQDDSKDPLDARRYRFANGTEGNHTLNPIPDTEDLNGNQHLDQDDNYVEFTVDLGDVQFLVDSTAAGLTEGDQAWLNGWRRFRVPMADPTRRSFGSPNLVFARNVRVWVEGLTQP